MPVTASTILTDIRTLGDLDAATTTLTDDQILMAIQWAHEHYYDIIVDADEGYFETSTTASIQANTSAITPAVTSTFRKIDLIEVIGTDGGRRPVVPLRAKKEKFQIAASGTVGRDSDLYYYLQGNAILLEPRPTQAATDALEITFVPEPVRINTATLTLAVPDNWAKVVTLRALSILDLRLRDGRNPKEDMVPMEAQLIQGLEGRHRQEPRRVIRVEDLDEYDGVYLG